MRFSQKIVFLSKFVSNVSGCDQADVHTVSHVFHDFPKDTVVCKFEEVLFEVVLGGSSHICVQTDILSHPWSFLVLYSSMYLRDLNSMTFVAFQSSVVHNILCFVIEIRKLVSLLFR